RTSDVWGQAGLDRGPFQTDPPWAHQVWRWINQNGANADYVSDQILQQAAFDGGKIAFGPMHYDALIVLGAKTLVPATAEALERYAQAGGKIVFAGDIPESSPGLQDAPANDAQVRTIIQSLLLNYPESVIRRSPPAATAPSLTEWRKNASAGQCLAWSDQLLTDLKIQRSVQFEKQTEGLYQIHYRSDDERDLYFFANTAQSNIAVRATFPAAGKHLECWNPETGTRSEFPVDKAGRTLIALPPAGSLLLAAGAGEALVAADLPVPPALTTVQEITGSWSVSFTPANGAAFEITPFTLAGLHESGDARLNRFAGQAVYKTDFVWDKSADKALHLDLGAVPNCITEVTLNGQLLGTRWYGRHDYIPDGAIQQGANHLEVKVVTTLFNRLRKDTETAVPSGLIGPVRLSAE
ncbi:MAG: glycosylhydrolase-like jelly roll fold domain-containing protein, partial [Kiritimatiellales bacterium]